MKVLESGDMLTDNNIAIAGALGGAVGAAVAANVAPEFDLKVEMRKCMAAKGYSLPPGANPY